MELQPKFDSKEEYHIRRKNIIFGIILFVTLKKINIYILNMAKVQNSKAMLFSKIHFWFLWNIIFAARSKNIIFLYFSFLFHCFLAFQSRNILILAKVRNSKTVFFSKIHFWSLWYISISLQVSKKQSLHFSFLFHYFLAFQSRKWVI